ncbi:MAG: hypothetical protein R2734_18415 [Nocardioides sp.]
MSQSALPSGALAADAAGPPGALMEFVHRRRRGAELFLLVLALAVGVGAYAAVGVGVQGAVPPTSSGTAAGWRRWSSAPTSSSG